MTFRKKTRLQPDDYINGIRNGNKIILSQAITLVESTLKEDTILAEEVMEGVIDLTGNSIRIGITGVPGVGKSTFIESFGKLITENGKKVAVLAIDPSSQKSGGSILGDKTRMELLSRNENAFIRPSSNRSVLGGVADKTREAMLLCEAGGFEVILIETVGVGQSEIAVKEMVDFFLLLMLAGAGDELQGIKKGIVEMADAIVITKADGSNASASEKARQAYQNALHLLAINDSNWFPKVLTCSAQENTGIVEVWRMIKEFESKTKNNHFWASKRKKQNIAWLHSCIDNFLKGWFLEHPDIATILPEIEQHVEDGAISPLKASRQLLAKFNAPNK